MKDILHIGIFLAVIIGWAMNIVEITHAASVTGWVVVRVIGVFMFPLGAVLGWL